MDVSAIASGAESLLKALEASRAPAGEGLVSEGPGAVPDGLAAEFRQMLDSVPAAEGTGVPAVDAGAGVQSAAEPALMSPEDLLRVQFDVSKVVLLSRFGDAAGQKPVQNVDSILKSQS